MVQFEQTWLQMADEHVIVPHLAFHTHDWEQYLLESHLMLQTPKKHLWEQAFLPGIG